VVKMKKKVIQRSKFQYYKCSRKYSPCYIFLFRMYSTTTSAFRNSPTLPSSVSPIQWVLVMLVILYFISGSAFLRYHLLISKSFGTYSTTGAKNGSRTLRKSAGNPIWGSVDWHL
jgi:hypothetical protein